jgi:hypothetical protein
MMLRLPHFLNIQLTNGTEVVSLKHWPPFMPQEDSWLLLEAEPTPAGRIRSIEKSNNLIRNRTPSFKWHNSGHAFIAKKADNSKGHIIIYCRDNKH